ncbi:hypothetical protein SDC9_202570 [bioreactor metagenome]|uniref:Uncharacterized protein n=1 Tax=bioreactor metagenome TaxID=1076179 RepID=A0A645IVK7_9ZZZZ
MPSAKLEDLSCRYSTGAIGWLSDSSSEDISNVMSCAAIRDSISRTSLLETPSSRATISTSSWLNQPRRCLVLRRLKNSLRCALVVATLTIRQLRRTYSWISALIQCTAKETRRTPTSGLKRRTAFIRPILPS